VNLQTDRPDLPDSAPSDRSPLPLLAPGGLVNGKTVQHILGISKTQLYFQVREGLLPPPRKDNPRLSRFLADEIQAVLRAVASGVDRAERRSLVRHLVATRPPAQT
jgi:predicted DNA-binding transcriptional regulator AlpA